MPGVLTNEQFPCVPGNLPWTLADIAGPASYTQVTTGSNPTGGQSVQMAALGFTTEILWAQSTGSDDGTYDIVVLMSPFNPLTGSQSITLMWVTAATGAQVTGGTNLSARTVRIMAMGR